MFQYTPLVLPFVLSTILLFGLGMHSLRFRDRVETAGLFSLQNFAMATWTLCYALELSNTTLEGKVFWAKMKYLGATTGPVLWLVFSLYYTNHRRWLTIPLKIFLGMFILLTLGVVFTNELHHWYWTNIYLLPGFPETQSEHGFYFWVYAAGAYALILASVVIYAFYLPTVPVYFRIQAFLLVLGTFLPLGIRILEDFVGWDPFPKVDNIILFLFLSAVLYALALFRFGALEIVPIAHNLVVHNINSGILVLDVAGCVVEINPFAQRWIGANSEHSIGKPVEEAIRNWPLIDDFSNINEQYEQEISLTEGNRTFYFLVQISPIHNERNKPLGQVLVFVDITDRKEAEMELARMARTDVLTGVINRRHFFELAEPHFDRAQRYKQSLAILLLDLDDFKQVNDRYGHLAGDLILQMVARECQQNLRSSDIFARYGGEEFICLLPEQARKGALNTAERICKTLAQSSVMYERQPIYTTASIGVAVIDEESDATLEELINRADQAMYEAKANGRNRVSVAGEKIA